MADVEQIDSDGDGSQFAVDDFSPRTTLRDASGLFLVLDPDGLIEPKNKLGLGVYGNDTRILSTYTWRINGLTPASVSAEAETGYSGVFRYGNRANHGMPRQSVLMERKLVVREGRLHEQVLVTNFYRAPVELTLTLLADADFADIFHVRGFAFHPRGKRMPPSVVQHQGRQGLLFSYRGTDDLWLETLVEFLGCEPDAITDGEAAFKLRLGPKETKELRLLVTPFEANSEQFVERLQKQQGEHVVPAEESEQLLTFQAVQATADDAYFAWRKSCAGIHTSNPLVNEVLQRGYRDIYMLRQHSPHGTGLVAGLPWYACPFGRDGAITARMVRLFMPDVARGVSSFLAAYQGTKFDELHAERPGKIMHELHCGELARLGAIVHNPYYGSVDATPLWLWLFADHVNQSGDIAFARNLWGNVERVLAYLDSEVARGNGYLVYGGEGKQALSHQGWKDSDDGIQRRDGAIAEAPVAVCEAQAYLYAAWTNMAGVAEFLGLDNLANRLRKSAKQLKDRFNQDFWVPDQNFLAMAVAGNGLADAIGSNAGHCLATGILTENHAHHVALRLMREDMLTRWGVRTLALTAVGYNPMGYHLGSVWPHDNVMFAEGLGVMGLHQQLHEIMNRLLSLVACMPDRRLPELVCGFDEPDLIHYWVACSPQSWDCGAFFQMIMACLGLQPDALHGILRICQPALPIWLPEVTVQGLRIGDTTVDLGFSLSARETEWRVLGNPGKLQIISA